MSISTIRRQVKNVAYNFSNAQVKVREATSNDPWGPSTALMSEIADLTHNPSSFAEIMSMLWKRLNDHGKNWRHVYKSLVLLDYLIKCGSDKIAQQCRENIYSIETLKDFQHIEDNRDQGINVRGKAKQMVALLYDEERLKNERTKFMMTRRKLLSGSALSSDGMARRVRKVDIGPAFDSELEDARPGSAGEEEMQLQIALAMSKEENEKEEELRKQDDIGLQRMILSALQMALNESRREIDRISKLVNTKPVVISGATLSQSAIDDLLSLGVGEPVAVAPNPWEASNSDPWAPSTGTSENLYPKLSETVCATKNDPWSLSLSPKTSGGGNDAFADPWSIATPVIPDAVPLNSSLDISEQNAKKRSNAKTPENFLGENSSLVNLENLMGITTDTPSKPANPFISGTNNSNGANANPFASHQRPSPSLNEMLLRSRNVDITGNISPTTQQHQPKNPFLL